MNKLARISAILTLAALTFCACAPKNGFYGGVPIDSEKMSEIRSEIFATELAESDKVSEDHTADKSSGNTIGDTGNITEEITESKEQNTEYTEDTEETIAESGNDGIVFWTKKGGVWHSSRDCRYIKNSEVESGDVDDAIEGGKDRACSSCCK